MTIRPCYHATCDAEDCTAHAFLADSRTSACRSRLTASGWLIIPARHRAEAPGAPRILYLCPEHHHVRPEGWREARAKQIRRLAVERKPRALDLSNVEPPTRHLDSARRAAMLWMLVETLGTQLAVARAAGVTRQWVSLEVAEYESILERRQRSAVGWQEPWARRLRAAGAIP